MCSCANKIKHATEHIHEHALTHIDRIGTHSNDKHNARNKDVHRIKEQYLTGHAIRKISHTQSHIYTNENARTHTCAHTHAQKNKNRHVMFKKFTSMCAHIHLHAHTYARTHTRTHTHTHTHTPGSL